MYFSFLLNFTFIYLVLSAPIIPPVIPISQVRDLLIGDNFKRLGYLVQQDQNFWRSLIGPNTTAAYTSLSDKLSSIDDYERIQTQISVLNLKLFERQIDYNSNAYTILLNSFKSLHEEFVTLRSTLSEINKKL